MAGPIGTDYSKTKSALGCGLRGGLLISATGGDLGGGSVWRDGDVGHAWQSVWQCAWQLLDSGRDRMGQMVVKVGGAEPFNKNLQTWHLCRICKGFKVVAGTGVEPVT